MRVRTLVLAFMLISAFPASGSETASHPQVTVLGTAVIQVVPDRLSWRAGVRTEGPKVPPIAKEHSATVAQVLAFLRGKGITEQNLQTDSMRYGEKSEYNGRAHVRVGYFASTAVSFTTPDMASYNDLWNGLAAIPGVSIDGVTFESSREIEYRADARQKAAVLARDKAKALASALGASVAEPLLIEEVEFIPDSMGNTNSIQRELVEDQSAHAIAPGRVAIRARVKATFRLVYPAK